MTTHVTTAFRLSDPSFWAIVLGNLLSIIMAVWQEWPIGEVMWIYWGQSVIIGVLNVLRMLSLKEFSTKGLRINGEVQPETEAAKRTVATFFAFHYGFFHFGYAMFLWDQLALSKLAMEDVALLLLCTCAFFASHSFSLMHNARADFKQKKPNLGTLMFYPYMRIIPMHLAIIFGGMMGGTGMLVIFMGLKTLADAGMHIVEHRIFQAPEKRKQPIRTED